jgi:hypothetical protein
MDEHGEHKDLRGSDHRSVIPYVSGTRGGTRTHLYREVWSEATTYVASRGCTPCSLSRLRACMRGYPVRHHHVSHGPGHRLLAEESSGVAMCPSAPDLASLPRWAPELSSARRRGPGLWDTWRRWSLPLPVGELQRCHVSLSSRPHFPTEVGSGASTCPMAPTFASPRGELRCNHIFHGPQWATDHRNKKRLSCPRHAARLICFQSMFVLY